MFTIVHACGMCIYVYACAFTILYVIGHAHGYHMCYVPVHEHVYAYVYVLVDLFVHAKYVYKILSCAGACAFGAPVNIQYICIHLHGYLSVDTRVLC